MKMSPARMTGTMVLAFFLCGLLLAGAAALSGCGSGGSATGGTGASGGAGLAAQALQPIGAPVEKSIEASSGGTVSIATPEGAVARIVFPRGALAADTDLSVTALAGGKGSGAVVGGFSLEQMGSGAGPRLAGPVIVTFALKGAVVANTSIVSYNADGSYSPVPTAVTSKDETSVLVATVSHFSAYGVRMLTPDEASAAKAAATQESAAFNWVVYVKDSKSVSKSGMKSTLSLDLQAVNTSGDIAGSYSATAKGTASNVWSGGLLIETFTVKVASFTFQLNPYFEMVPLTEEKDAGGLAPLDTQVDYQGYGTMTLTTSGKGEAHVSGQTVAVPVKPKTSKAKFTISVFGPELRMTVVDSTGSTYYFDGYVRGEGK